MTHSSAPDGTDPKSPAQVAPAALKTLRLLTLTALVVALIAVAVAVAGWLRPTGTTSPPTFTDEQVADAKTKICTAFINVRQAVIANTNQANPVEGDPIGELAVASNARLALYSGGGYLRDHLAREPATSADLTVAVNSMANTLEDLSISYLAMSESGQDSLRNDLDAQMQHVDELCA